MIKILLSILLLIPVSFARAITISSAPDVSEVARNAARAFLLANPNRRLGCIANTRSMVPTFDSGYIVVLEPKSFASLKRDEIVVFDAEWAPTAVVHRLHYRMHSGWLTKGDHLSKPDPTLLTERNYLGTVVIAAIHKQTGRVTTSDMR